MSLGGGGTNMDHSKYNVQVKECRMNGPVSENQFTIFININTKSMRPFSRIYELKSTLNPFKSYEIYALDVIIMSREKGSAPFGHSRLQSVEFHGLKGCNLQHRKMYPECNLL